MSEFTHRHQPGTEVYKSREIALDVERQVDLIFAAQSLSRTLPLDPISTKDYETQINGILLQPGLQSIDLINATNGTDFAKLDVALSGPRKNQSIDLHFTSGMIGQSTRIISFLDTDDENVFDIEDSRINKTITEELEVATEIKRSVLTRYLASQLILDPEWASQFVHQQGDEAVIEAVEALTMRAKEVVRTDTAGHSVRFSQRRHGLLHVQVVKGFSPVENVIYDTPTHKHISAWIRQKHLPLTRALRGVPLVRRTHVAIATTRNVRAHPDHDAPESFRLSLSAPAGTPEKLVEAELNQMAVNRHGRFTADIIKASQMFKHLDADSSLH